MPLYQTHTCLTSAPSSFFTSILQAPSTPSFFFYSLLEFFSLSTTGFSFTATLCSQAVTALIKIINVSKLVVSV